MGGAFLQHARNPVGRLGRLVCNPFEFILAWM
jgi:hypothetical protein